jgi:dual specificity phosphatase 12
MFLYKATAYGSLAGRSRSATIVAAYLMQRFNIDVEEAIQRIHVVRVVDPNYGFRKQLQVYLDCNFVPDSTKAAYRHWRLRKETQLQKSISLSRPRLIKGATGKYGKPDVVNYATADTVVDDQSESPVVDLRCKMCRYFFL